MTLPLRRVLKAGGFIILASVVAGLPVLMGTSTYPLAIVNGISMWPKLQNGDLVVFRRSQGATILNGTVIVFVQGDSGVSALDSLIRPVVVHRIIDTVIQADGVVYYRTKGDNNQFVDPALVQSDHVLGVQGYVVPKVGIIALFAESPQGLVAMIGMISLYYIGKFDVALRDDKVRGTFCGKLSELALRGDISMDLFGRLEAAVRHSSTIRLEGTVDRRIVGIVEWIREGALDNGWDVIGERCPACGRTANRFVSKKGASLLLCSCCESVAEGIVATTRMRP